MKRLMCFLVLLLLFGITLAAWAGAAEELAQVRRQRGQAYHEGNLEMFMVTWADNGTFIPSLSPFRVEGKEAIRAFYERLFDAFPTRRFVTQQGSVRFYNNDTAAVVNTYYTLTLVDRAGKGSTTHGRLSQTYVKLGGQWVVADQHLSVLPASP